jgi:hypothetical protein
MTIKTKILFDNIQINDPVALFSGDVNAELKNMLSRKYANKCYMSSLILSIIRIIRRGDCLVNQNAVNKQNANPVFGYMYVEFEVECMVYNAGEIITGCVVHNTDDYLNIYCETSYANIYLKNSKYNSTIQTGQIISVVVENTVYDVLQEKFSVSGVIFVPTTYSFAYEISATSNPTDTLFSLLDDLDLNNVDMTTVAWKSFTELVSPYKKTTTFPEIKGKQIDFFEYIRNYQPTNQPKFILRTSTTGNTSTTIYLINNEADLPEESTIIRGLSFDSMMIAIIGNYQNYINLIAGMCENYSNEEEIKRHSNLWRLYNSCKI